MTVAAPMLQVLRWPLAGVAILSAHLALADWLLGSWSSDQSASAPAPIYIDLEPAASPPQPQAPQPPAPSAPEAEPAPRTAPEAAVTDAPEPEPEPEPKQGTVKVASFTPPPLTRLPALDDPTDLFPAITSALALSQSERPQAKPKPRPRRETQAETARHQTKEPARRQPQATARAAAPAPAAPAPAAPTPAAPPPAAPPPAPSAEPTAPAQAPRAAPAATGPREIANWQTQVGARIVRHMSRTRLPGGGGQVNVQLIVTVGANGATSAQLGSSTGDGRVDQALTRQAARMPRMPAPPDGQSQSFVLPVGIVVR